MQIPVSLKSSTLNSGFIQSSDGNAQFIFTDVSSPFHLWYPVQVTIGDVYESAGHYLVAKSLGTEYVLQFSTLNIAFDIFGTVDVQDLLLLLQPCYDPLSGTTQMSRYQKDKPFWILLKQT